MLNHLFNMLGYNPNGREGPTTAGREEGYLFWLAWLDHTATRCSPPSDANGSFRPVTVGGAVRDAASSVADAVRLDQLGAARC